MLKSQNVSTILDPIVNMIGRVYVITLKRTFYFDFVISFWILIVGLKIDYT